MVNAITLAGYFGRQLNLFPKLYFAEQNFLELVDLPQQIYRWCEVVCLEVAMVPLDPYSGCLLLEVPSFQRCQYVSAEYEVLPEQYC